MSIAPAVFNVPTVGITYIEAADNLNDSTEAADANKGPASV
jgi:hypothetical protein